MSVLPSSRNICGVCELRFVWSRPPNRPHALRSRAEGDCAGSSPDQAAGNSKTIDVVASAQISDAGALLYPRTKGDPRASLVQRALVGATCPAQMASLGDLAPARQCIDKSRTQEYILLQKQTRGQRKSGSEKGEACLGSVSRITLGSELSPAANFPISFARKPLKRLDSEK